MLPSDNGDDRSEIFGNSSYLSPIKIGAGGLYYVRGTILWEGELTEWKDRIS
jgi:hypothetical protein